MPQTPTIADGLLRGPPGREFLWARAWVARHERALLRGVLVLLLVLVLLHQRA